jgi:hypothetical protein
MIYIPASVSIDACGCPLLEYFLELKGTFLQYRDNDKVFVPFFCAKYSFLALHNLARLHFIYSMLVPPL